LFYTTRNERADEISMAILPLHFSSTEQTTPSFHPISKHLPVYVYLQSFLYKPTPLLSFCTHCLLNFFLLLALSLVFCKQQ
jgi:hypothetical protein